jgi:DNA-binding MarR family transcriptional regulator
MSAAASGRRASADPGMPDRRVADPPPPADGGLDASHLTHLVGYGASRAAIEMRKVFTRHMKPLGLKVVEFSILMLVAANRQVNQKQIGQALDISAPNLAVILDRMVERGWVLRVRSEQDRRAQHIHLTAKGVELVQRARKIAATMEDASLRMLSSAERALLIELLLKVASGKSAPR